MHYHLHRVPQACHITTCPRVYFLLLLNDGTLIPSCITLSRYTGGVQHPALEGTGTPNSHLTPHVREQSSVE